MLLSRGYSPRLGKCVDLKSKPSLREHREFFDSVFNKLGFQHITDWYLVTYDSLLKFGGSKYLYTLFDGSPSLAVTSLFAEHPWDIYRFSTLPRGFWDALANQRMFMEKLCDRLGLGNHTADRYRITQKEYLQHGGSTLLKIYCGSPSLILKNVYPECMWELHRFNTPPNSYWTKLESQREFLDFIAVQLEFGKLAEGGNLYMRMKDWYNISEKDLADNGGQTLLNHYNSVPSDAVMCIYPEYPWENHRFITCQNTRFWSKIENQRVFFDQLFSRLGLERIEDWYKITQGWFADNGASLLLEQFYHNSPSKAIKCVYPEHKWECKWLHILKDVERELKITSLDEWYRVSTSQFKWFGFYGNCEAMMDVLKYHYPNHSWDFARFSYRNKKATQRWLKCLVEEIFPAQTVLEDYYHPELIFPNTGRCMQLDIFLPDLNIAFEYNGIQHYEEISHAFKHRDHGISDEDKKRACLHAPQPITLIVIPYWWDQKLASLQNTIRQHLPELE